MEITIGNFAKFSIVSFSIVLSLELLFLKIKELESLIERKIK